MIITLLLVISFYINSCKIDIKYYYITLCINMYDPNQQDWGEVTWNKKTKQAAAGSTQHEVETVKKSKNMDAIHKLENSEETSHKRVSFDMKRKIQKARMDKKRTQKQVCMGRYYRKW
jgi:hypothetical protein